MLTDEEAAIIEAGRTREIVVEFDGGARVRAYGDDALVLAFELGGWRPRRGPDGRPVAEFDLRHDADRFRRLAALGMRFRVVDRGSGGGGSHFLDLVARDGNRELLASAFG